MQEMADYTKDIALGATFFSTASSSIIMGGKISEEIKVDVLSRKIKEYIKDRGSVSVSELIEHFEESANIVFMALKKLKDAGFINEVGR